MDRGLRDAWIRWIGDGGGHDVGDSEERTGMVVVSLPHRIPSDLSPSDPVHPTAIPI